jgi:Gluconate 2-dehydrogenase subunit 3
MSTRRSALKSIAVAAVSLPAVAQHQHDGAIVEITKAYAPKVFDTEQMKTVAGLVDLIIPRTDTPGASDARVHEYIDRALSRSAPRKTRFLAGLQELKDSNFDTLAADEKIARLNAISGTPFFKLLKDLTVDGYYTSKEGLTEELGWHGNTFLAEFKGCTHPEHQS